MTACQYIADTKQIFIRAVFAEKNLSGINPCEIRISHPRGWIFWQGTRQAVWFPYPTWIFMVDSINFAPVWCLDLKHLSGDLLTCDRPSLRGSALINLRSWHDFTKTCLEHGCFRTFNKRQNHFRFGGAKKWCDFLCSSGEKFNIFRILSNIGLCLHFLDIPGMLCYL